MWPSGRFGGGSKALAPTKPPSSPLSSSPSCADTRTKSTSSIDSSTSTSATSTSSRSSSASLSSSSSPSSSSSSRGLFQSAFPFLPGFFSSFSGYGGGGGARDTFKPIKEHISGKRISLHRYSQATLATGITRAAVACPASEDPDEWLAVQTVDVYNELALLFGVIHGKCLESNESCAVMNAGPEYEYLWADNNLYKKPTKVSAKEYVGLLFQWVEEQLNDPFVFPPSTDVAFPRNFRLTVAKIFTRMFRVYAHIYLTHVKDMERAGAIHHLNSCFRNFLFCALEFDLIEERELAPLQVLIRSILIEDARRHAAEHKSSPSSLKALGRPSSAAASATHSPHQARLQRLGSNSVNATSSSLRPGKGGASSPAPPSPTPPPRKERASFPSSFFSLSSSSSSSSSSSLSSSSSSSAASPSSSTSRASRPQHRVPRSNSTSSGDTSSNGSGSNKLNNMMMQGLQPRDASARPQKVAGGGVSQSMRL